MKKFKDATIKRLTEHIFHKYAEAAMHFNNIEIETKVALAKLQQRCRHSQRHRHDYDTSPWTQCSICGTNLSDRRKTK